jgi:hypothetical protein
MSLFGRAIEAVGERARLDRVYATSIESLVAEGQRKFPEGVPNFQSSALPEPLKGMHYPVRGVVVGGQELIVKSKVPEGEIHAARAMQELGIGPEADVLRETQGQPRPVYHLVMKRADGVNSKVLVWIADYLNHPESYKDLEPEVHFEPSYIAAMRSEIETILGKRFTSDREAYQAYARAILEDAPLMARLQEIGDILSSHFSQLPDFQLMIRPSVGSSPFSAQVIDAGRAARKDTFLQSLDARKKQWQLRRGIQPDLTIEDLRRLGRRAHPDPAPSAEVEAWIARLRRVAAGLPL